LVRCLKWNHIELLIILAGDYIKRISLNYKRGADIKITRLNLIYLIFITHIFRLQNVWNWLQCDQRLNNRLVYFRKTSLASGSTRPTSTQTLPSTRPTSSSSGIRTCPGGERPSTFARRPGIPDTWWLGSPSTVGKKPKCFYISTVIVLI